MRLLAPPADRVAYTGRSVSPFVTRVIELDERSKRLSGLLLSRFRGQPKRQQPPLKVLLSERAHADNAAISVDQVEVRQIDAEGSAPVKPVRIVVSDREPHFRAM